VLPVRGNKIAYCKSCPVGSLNCDGDSSCECATYPNSLPTCINNQCTVNCATNFGNCNFNVTDGCETNIKTDRNHCGTCGNPCTANDVCLNGICSPPCSAPFTTCPGTATCAIDSSLDPNNCGTCGTICQAGMAAGPTENNVVFTGNCVNGQCETGCKFGFKNCFQGRDFDCETNIMTDPTNCGDCNQNCPFQFLLNVDRICSQGQCGQRCSQNLITCYPEYVVGSPFFDLSCETNNLSPKHCGSCGNNCPIAPLNIPNIQSVCRDTSSGPSCLGFECKVGYSDCDSQIGCECQGSCVPCPNGVGKCCVNYVQQTISGIVLFQQTDMAIPGIIVELLDVNWNPIRTTLTDNSGMYSFSLNAGPYIVLISIQSNPTLKNHTVIAAFDVKPVSICQITSNCGANSCTKQPCSDPTLICPCGNPVDSNPQPLHRAINVGCGSCIKSVRGPFGASCLDGSSIKSCDTEKYYSEALVPSLTSPGPNLPVTWFFKPNLHSGKIWIDINADGIIQPGEPGIPDVKVFITDLNNIIQTTITDSFGFYQFSIPEIFGQERSYRPAIYLELSSTGLAILNISIPLKVVPYKYQGPNGISSSGIVKVPDSQFSLCTTSPCLNYYDNSCEIDYGCMFEQYCLPCLSFNNVSGPCIRGYTVTCGTKPFVHAIFNQGAIDNGFNFGFAPETAIFLGDFVFGDKIANNIYDPFDDIIFVGAQLELVVNNVVVQTTVTTSEGYYQFTQATLGSSYSIRLNLTSLNFQNPSDCYMNISNNIDYTLNEIGNIPFLETKPQILTEHNSINSLIDFVVSVGQREPTTGQCL